MSDDASRLIGSVVEVVRVEQPDRTMSAVVWGLATHGLDDVPDVAFVRRREGLWQINDRAAVVVVAPAGEVLLAEVSQVTRRGIATHLAESHEAIPDGDMREREVGPPAWTRPTGLSLPPPLLQLPPGE